MFSVCSLHKNLMSFTIYEITMNRLSVFGVFTGQCRNKPPPNALTREGWTVQSMALTDYDSYVIYASWLQYHVKSLSEQLSGDD